MNKKHQLKILYSTNFSYKSERNKNFLRQLKAEDIYQQYTCLARTVKEVLQRKGKWYRSETQIYTKSQCKGEGVNESKVIKFFSYS